MNRRKLRDKFEVQTKMSSEQSRKSMCSKHPEREVVMYCRTCRFFGCMVCLKSTHQQHIWKDVRDKIKAFVEDDSRNSRKLEEMKKMVMEDERREIRANVLSDTIHLISVKKFDEYNATVFGSSRRYGTN